MHPRGMYIFEILEQGKKYVHPE